MSSRRKVLYGFVVAAVAIVLGMAGGCMAHRRPSLTAEERALLAQPPLPYSVSIVNWDAKQRARMTRNPDAYANALAGVAIPSRAFREMRREHGDVPALDADLAGTSTGTYCNTALIPVPSIISLGVIPTIWQEQDCEGMSLRSTKFPDRPPVRIDVQFKGTSMLGWVSLVMGALPGWSWGDIRGDAAYHQRFRLEVIRHRQEIERLVADH